MKKELIIGTFNLKNDMWNKDWNYKKYAGILADYIIKNKVSFLACQELTNKYSIELRKLLFGYNIYGKYRFKKIKFLSRYDERVGIITKDKPTKIYNKYLSLFPGIPRVMSVFEDNSIMLINIHLDYNSMLAKKIGLKKLYRFIYKHRNKNIIILGDFNLRNTNIYFNEFKNKLYKIGINFVDDERKKTIDHVFISNKIRVIDVWNDKELGVISDHLPIFIKIMLKNS